MRSAALLALLALASPALAHDAAYHSKEQRLAKIGSAVVAVTLRSFCFKPIS